MRNLLVLALLSPQGLVLVPGRDPNAVSVALALSGLGLGLRRWRSWMTRLIDVFAHLGPSFLLQ